MVSELPGISPTAHRSPSLFARWRRRLWVVRVLGRGARLWALRRFLESAPERARRVAAATLGDGGRLVFVCHGNIMRSAFATRVVHERYPQHHARVIGGGTHAKAGRPAQDVALTVAEQMRLPMADHRATPLEALMLREYDVVVCMDALNESNVLAAYPSLARRVFRVGDLGAVRETVPLADRELHDPYGKGEHVTRATFEALHSLADGWAVHVLPR
jgi:protein-tyrosine phosphatase